MHCLFTNWQQERNVIGPRKQLFIKNRRKKILIVR